VVQRAPNNEVSEKVFGSNDPKAATKMVVIEPSIFLSTPSKKGVGWPGLERSEAPAEQPVSSCFARRFVALQPAWLSL